jgi:hypothetical protein
MRHPYRVVALLAVFSLCLSAAPNVQEQVEKWSQGRRLAVVLRTGDKVVGRLGSVQKEGFGLVSEKRGHAERFFRFDEVQSVKTKMTTATKWGIAGAIYAPFMVMGLILGK